MLGKRRLIYFGDSPFARFIILSLLIVVGIIDFMMSLSGLNATSNTIAIIAMIGIVISVLSMTRLSPDIVILTALSVFAIAFLGFAVPWIICKSFPHQRAVCGCVETKSVNRMFLMLMAMSITAFVYTIRKYP